MVLKKNEKYTIDITALSSEGMGIGKIDGFTLFVDNTAIGDKAEILIVKLKKSYGYGKLLKILKPSRQRTVPSCPYFNRCGGCSLQHISYEAQLDFKTKKIRDNISRIGGFENPNVLPTIGMENPFNYRNKAQYPIGTENGEICYGFFAKHSHRIIPVDNCLIGNPADTDILNRLKGFIKKHNISTYNEQSHNGIIRHALIRSSLKTGEAMLCLVVNCKQFKFKNELIEEFRDLTSLVLNYNTEKTNTILGLKCETLNGRGYITDYIGDFKFEISPLSFFQVNPTQTNVIYSKVLEFAGLSGNETVIDAYCGIGTISMFLAQKAKKVYGIEIVPQAIDDANRNKELNHIDNIEFIVGKSEEIIPKLFDEANLKPEVIVVDPPRKGCDSALIDTILKMKPDKIVYVSCDSATLARDLKLLCQSDYRLEIAQGVDMFCQTHHVETVVLLSKTR